MGECQPFSVAIIAYNEERNLPRCLTSVQSADEIVLVDSGSTDRTRAVARAHRARVIEQPWLGYVAQKNFAVGQTTHSWVLSLDADEWLTADGAAEIRAALRDPRADAYAFNRRTAFSGAFLRRVWNPDWQVRLFRKDKGRFEGGQVHESVRMDPGARTLRLEVRLPHLAYRSIRDYVERMNRYTDLAARTLQEQGRPNSLTRLMLSPPATFLKLYVLKRGFLDGIRGWVVSAGSAFYVLLKYAKLWELSRQGDPELE